MKRLKYLVPALVGLLAASPAAAQVVIMGTTTQGSLAYNTGVALAKVVSSKTDVKMRVQPLGGTSNYIPMINRKEVLFGAITGLDVMNAAKGNLNFAGQKQENLRAVGVAYPLRTGVVVVADAPIQKLSELKNYKGKRVPSQYTSMKLIEQQLDLAFTLAGLKYEDFTKVPVSGFVQGMNALGEGRVDISWISLGSAAGRKVDAQLRSQGGFRYLDIDLDDKAKKYLEDNFPPVSVVTESNLKMPGIKKPTRIFQQNMIILTHKDAPEELIYKVAKVMATEKTELGKAFGIFNRMNTKTLGTDPTIPYHPGAVKLYKELGLPAR